MARRAAKRRDLVFSCPLSHRSYLLVADNSLPRHCEVLGPKLARGDWRR